MTQDRGTIEEEEEEEKENEEEKEEEEQEEEDVCCELAPMVNVRDREANIV